MANVRGNAAAKWSRRTASATQEFTEGVQNPRASWQKSTLAAEANHTAGVQQAIVNKSFAKGVAKSSDASWSNATLTKGADRFAGGVTAAEGDYAKGVAPYTQALQALQLPARGPKGDPKNLERVRAVTTTLRSVKMGKA